MNRFNKGGIDWGVKTDDMKYIKLSEFPVSDDIIKIRGVFINGKGNFGAHPVAIGEYGLIDLPAHLTDAVKEITGVGFHKIDTDEEARAAAIAYGMDADEVKEMSRGKLIAEMFEEYCEDVPGFLDGPVFVVGHPVEVSPLAKRDPKDPRITRRFEGYINGWEICNAFSELNDPIDQYERFVEQQRQLDCGEDDEAHPMDMDFVNALEVGLPPTGGLGIGIDRVIMLICDAPSIRDIILFPTMKPLESEKRKAPVVEEVVDLSKLDFSKVEIEPLFEEFVDFETFSKSDFRAVKVKSCEAVPKSAKLLKFVLDDGTDTDRVILSGIHPYYEPEELEGKTLVAITNLPPRKMMGLDSCGMLFSAVHKENGEEKAQKLHTVVCKFVLLCLGRAEVCGADGGVHPARVSVCTTD